jgi:FKBP-type peptidyl-prolyl cis-trans isomerase FklB
MRKPITILAILFTTGALLIGISRAQQTPAPSSQQTQAAGSQTAQPAPAAKAATSPSGTSKTPAAKSGTAAKGKAAAPFTLKTQKDKESYALGMNVGMGLGAKLKQQSVDIDQAILLRGMKDALAGSKTLLTEDEERAALTQLTADVRAQQEAKAKLAAESNKKEGADFLASNKTKDGVVALPSGLQYKVLTEGTGPKPTAADTVVCNYRGTLLSGKEFDSSYKRGQPATFPVSGVIKGWTEALQLMPVGSKWQLFIPSDLGYGDRGAGGDIGPGATLVFEVELVSIQEKSPAAAAPASPAAPATPTTPAAANPQKPPTPNKN